MSKKFSKILHDDEKSIYQKGIDWSHQPLNERFYFLDVHGLKHKHHIPFLSREELVLLVQEDVFNSIDFGSFIVIYKKFSEVWNKLVQITISNTYEDVSEIQEYFIWIKNIFLELLLRLTDGEILINDYKCKTLIDQDTQDEYLAIFIELNGPIEKILEFEIEALPDIYFNKHYREFDYLDIHFFFDQTVPTV